MSLVRNANSILSIFDRVESLDLRGEITSDNLCIQVHGEDSNIDNWLKENFAFITDQSVSNAVDNHRVAVVCSDLWVQNIIEIFDAGQFSSQIYSRRGIVFYRIKISSHVHIDYLPSVGCAWITQQSGWLGNTDNNLVVLIYSSRTPLHFRELRIGLIDIINRYFESRGWHTLHAGAVKATTSSKKTVMIVGASHSGKTSLILELLKNQFQFIGNERLFCRATKEGIRINSFPQPINVGLGTALHHDEIKELINRPDRCSYLQSMFETSRVWNTPPEELSQLPDKIKLLPHELINAFGAQPSVASSIVSAIIVPSIGDEPQTIAEVLTFEEVHQILCENYFASVNDQIYPRWLPIEYDYHAELNPMPIIDQLCKVPAWRVRYSGSQTESLLPVLQDVGVA